MKLIKFQINPPCNVVLELEDLSAEQLTELTRKFVLQQSDPDGEARPRKKYNLTEEQKERYRERAKLAREARLKKLADQKAQAPEDAEHIKRLAEEHEARKKREQELRAQEQEAMHQIEVMNAEEAMQKHEVLGKREIEEIEREEQEDEAE